MKLALTLLKEKEYISSVNFIIITSQRTVECLNECILPVLDAEHKSLLLNKVIYTVGPATAEYLQQSGFKNIRGGKEAGNGNILADIIISDLQHSTEDFLLKNHGPILFFVGQIRKDIILKKLSKSDISIREVVVYDTKELQDNVIRFQECVKNSVTNYVVVFSPQGMNEIVDYLKDQPNSSKFRIASIGPTTKKYLEEKGLSNVIVSPKPDAVSLLNEIEMHPLK